ncbi:DUF2877 domain-containing protein [Bacillus sp. FJAT-29814]|uniref:DUF2877 domain-containing protein n=1 Tax=Bacillus sp. FJAT-29814 TaxID=1729688 RepID=UPI0008337B57|nr:DUF2877 domain-containing protein [Bacillus sp. FJAT-29814]
MREIISGDVDFIHRIHDSEFNGFVHSTFNQTFNIHCLEDGELYTIAGSKIDNAPNTFIIDVDHVSSMKIEVNDKVYVVNKVLYIEDKLALSIDKAAAWQGQIPSYPSNVEVLKRNLMTMKEYLRIHGKAGGIKKPLVTNSPFEAEMAEMLEKRVALFLDELLNNRMSHALPHAVSILGLGPGLTPSGDDFLVGLFTVLNMKNCPYNKWWLFCDAVTTKAKTLTNDISYMALKKAATGKVRESIISLLNSLLIGNEEDLILSLNKVINIGSSSGTDIAFGLIYGLEANINAGGKL